MNYQDKTLKCKDCGADFVWTASEQDFYAKKGFENAPQRCPACRAARKQQARGPRRMYPATCADCGRSFELPFEPKQDRPVYCNECYAKHKNR